MPDPPEAGFSRLFAIEKIADVGVVLIRPLTLTKLGVLDSRSFSQGSTVRWERDLL